MVFAGPLGWLRRDINLPLFVLAIALTAFALMAGPYHLRLLAVIGINALLVVGFQFVFGFAGAVSLAQSCFFGVGAYVTAILGTTFGLETTVTFPLSVAAAGFLAMLIAVPIMRLDDNYFALATLALSLLVELAVTQWDSVTGGTNGLSGVPPLTIFGVAATDRFQVLLIVWTVVGAGLLLAQHLRSGLYGRMFHLMRQSAPAASALGFDVARMRFAAFVASALFGGASGALMANVVRVVSPELLGLPLMVTCLTMTVLGGRLSVAGAILGALLITYLREYFRFLESYTLIVYGSLSLGCLILAPDGIIGTLEHFRAKLPGGRSGPVPGRLSSPVADALPFKGVMLALRGISLSFGGIRALDAVSLDVSPGEIVGLIGPNGSGKTTLLNVISGLYVPDGGTVTVLDRNTAGLQPFAVARLGVARTFQHIHLVDDMTVLDNVALGYAGSVGTGALQALRAVRHDDGLAAARAAAGAAVGLMGIADRIHDRCGALSYGTRRRVEVARALAARPQLLLLDEPAAGFNEQEQRDLAERIKLIAASGTTVLVVEHNLVFLAAVATRLVCLDRGRVIADGPAATVRANPAVIEAYLGKGS